MANPTEGIHSIRTIDDQEFDVWPLTWPDGSQSWEVMRISDSELLTMNGSLDENPSDQAIINLCDGLICRTCEDAVLNTDYSLKEHMGNWHHDGAFALSAEQIRDCFRSEL